MHRRGPGLIALVTLGCTSACNWVLGVHDFAATVDAPSGDALDGAMVNPGAFQEAVTVLTGREPIALAAGDLDSNHTIDLVTANNTDNSLTILSNGPVGFSLEAIPTGFGPVWVGIRQIDEDDLLDLVVVNRASNNLGLYLGSGNGNFASPNTFMTRPAPSFAAFADVNSDSRIDVVMTSNDETWVLRNGTDGFETPMLLPIAVANMGAIASGSLGASPPDLVVTSAFPGTPRLIVLLDVNSPPSSFTYPTGDTPVAVATGDLDRDGKDEVVVVCEGGNVTNVFANLGDGGLDRPASLVGGVQPVAVALGDLTNDGSLDLVVANAASNTISVFINRGDGTFLAPDSYTTGLLPHAVIIANLNDDNLPDLAVANAASDSVSIFYHTR